MDYYKKLICMLEAYFSCYNWKKLFLEGGCFWFAGQLYEKIPESVIMINRMEEHCAVYFENGLYDVTGKISSKGFRVAGEREISFMKKTTFLTLRWKN